MRKRIAIGGIWHETNGFAAGRTELDDFHAYQYAEGEALLERYRGTGTELGGMIAAAGQCGFELLPTLFAAAVPSATIARPALDALCDGILARLDAFGAVDGMLLVLHGAAAAEGDRRRGRARAGADPRSPSPAPAHRRDPSTFTPT